MNAAESLPLSDVLRSIIIEANPEMPSISVERLVTKYLGAGYAASTYLEQDHRFNLTYAKGPF